MFVYASSTSSGSCQTTWNFNNRQLVDIVDCLVDSRQMYHFIVAIFNMKRNVGFSMKTVYSLLG